MGSVDGWVGNGVSWWTGWYWGQLLDGLVRGSVDGWVVMGSVLGRVSIGVIWWMGWYWGQLVDGLVRGSVGGIAPAPAGLCSYPEHRESQHVPGLLSRSTPCLQAIQ